MATKKTTKAATPADEKFQNQDFVLFEALDALDRKDYEYYDRLTDEQQKKFVAYMMIHWMSAIKGQSLTQAAYTLGVNEYANIHYFNENVMKHPKLQWLMLCAASPGKGKQFHQWIPHLKASIAELREPAKLKDVKDYYSKIYPKADSESLTMIGEAFVEENKKKFYLAKLYPGMKLSDIELLSQTITEEDIANYEKERGN